MFVIEGDSRGGGTTIEDPNTGAKAEVGPASGISESDNLLGVKDPSLGLIADAEATANGTLIAVVKRLRTLLNGGLPAALTAGGSLKTGSADGEHVAIGATADLDTANTVVGRLKKMVALLAGGLPAALTGSGNLKAALVESTATVTVDSELPAAAALADNAANPTAPAVGAFAGAFDGATWDRVRTPTTFKSVQATASGDTAVWTPAAGKKFRLMRFKVQVTSNATLAAGAVLSIALRDATTSLSVTHDVFVPMTATATNGHDSDWLDLGNGVLSALADNVLNVNLSAAVTAGNVRVIVCGTEE